MLSLRTSWIIGTLVAVGLGVITVRYSQSAPTIAEGQRPGELKLAVRLPISQVILFNSGVGHFTRSGEVEGNARVDLVFPEKDVNDLIKSLTLRDLSGNGRVAAVTYDSHDPIDRTLASFAINLNNNPTLAQILQQARGEAVEVTLTSGANQPGSLTGKIVGLEPQEVPVKDGKVATTVLNLWCAEGVRAVKLSEVQRLRFVNPLIENEVRRALETLALSHDSQKKAVGLEFVGEGRRKVEVGYVVENPIWKTSYRLVLSDKGPKPFLQGWAVVENPTDEDWVGVTMALVSGRPISFQMDLYNPLYVTRPTVEPEFFASLRPPTYSGRMRGPDDELKQIRKEQDRLEDNKTRSAVRSSGPAPDSLLLGGSGNGVVDEERMRSFVQTWGTMSATQRKKAIEEVTAGLAPKYRVVIEDYFRSVSSGKDGKEVEESLRLWLRTAELAERMGSPLDIRNSVQSIATASALGEYYQYVIDRPVDLARQKSALLPIVNKDVEGTRVSIYNPAVQAKHPLLGLRFKNTSGMPLSQGPMTVFEGSVYAGDTRVLDLQPGEERLVSYAIDLGTEVSRKAIDGTTRITKVKAVKGVITTERIEREEVVYDLSNRSTTDRTIVLEHPNRKGEGFGFVGTNKPKEEAADVFRFEVPLAAKKNTSFTVVEERPVAASIALTNSADETIQHFLQMKEVPEALKDRLRQAQELKATVQARQREIDDANKRVQTIEADQKRLRENLRELPKESKLFEKYLSTLERQETEMDQLQAKLKHLQMVEAVTRGVYEKFLANLTVE